MFMYELHVIPYSLPHICSAAYICDQYDITRGESCKIQDCPNMHKNFAADYCVILANQDICGTLAVAGW